ncbi:unnamed protein product [Mytilus coruscus]|nr:unnamed protein product [Mytilus coruscus]CAC5388768.1 unnamed protein product [Mytilus coruscus]
MATLRNINWENILALSIRVIFLGFLDTIFRFSYQYLGWASYIVRCLGLLILLVVTGLPYSILLTVFRIMLGTSNIIIAWLVTSLFIKCGETPEYPVHILIILKLVQISLILFYYWFNEFCYFIVKGMYESTQEELGLLICYIVNVYLCTTDMIFFDMEPFDRGIFLSSRIVFLAVCSAEFCSIIVELASADVVAMQASGFNTLRVIGVHIAFCMGCVAILYGLIVQYSMKDLGIFLTTAYSVCSLIKSFASLFIFCLYKFDESRQGFWENFDDVIFYTRITVYTITLVIFMPTACVGVWTVFYGFYTWFDLYRLLSMLLVNVFFGINVLLNTIRQRKRVLEYTTTLEDASNSQLNRDNCSICLQEMMKGKNTSHIGAVTKRTMSSKFKAIRAGHRGAVTNLIKRVSGNFEELLQEYNVNELIEMIRKKETVISELNDKIVEEISEEDIQEEVEKADRNIRQNVVRVHGNARWNLQLLRDVIQHEITIQEAGQSVNCYELESEYTPTSAFIASKKPNYNSNNRNLTSNPCIYCNDIHAPTACMKVKNIDDRKRTIKEKQLCFNCLGSHKIAHCKSKEKPVKIGKRHHTSICDTNEQHSQDKE